MTLKKSLWNEPITKLNKEILGKQTTIEKVIPGAPKEGKLFGGAQKIDSCMQLFEPVIGGPKSKSLKEPCAFLDELRSKRTFEQDELKAEFEPLTTLMKEVLGDKVDKKVMISSWVANSPCVLTASELGGSANINCFIKAQALRDNSMTSYIVSKKTIEVNPKHSIMTELNKKAAADKSDKTVKDLIMLFFEASLVTPGINLDEPSGTGPAER